MWSGHGGHAAGQGKVKAPRDSGKQLIVVQLLSPVGLFANSWTAAPQASLSFTITRSLLKLMSIE